METTTKIKQWNAVLRHVESGQWVTRIKASFDDKREAISFIKENTSEHLELIRKDQLLKDTQYKPSTS